MGINTLIITSALGVLLCLILVMIVLLLLVRKKLVPSGLVTLNINAGEIKLEVSPGENLLSCLGDNEIYLPSACGGTGTCGMCKCQVISGAGTILPTETGFFSRKEQHEDWRLSCQVKIRENLEIKVSEEILGIRKWDCEVVSNRNVATFIKEFVVKLPEGENLNFKSGGYIQIDIPKCKIDFSKDIHVEEEFREDWDAMNIWDLKMNNNEETFRAYSMANHPAEGNVIMLNIRIATPPWDRNTNAFAKVNPGVCSSYIFAQKPGDKVIISGPYGEFFLRDTDSEMMFIGGGAGMAPMRSHIFHLFHTLKTDRKVTFWYGARSSKEVFYEEDFRAIERKFPNFKFVIALSDPKQEDNWTGYTGFIHQVIYDNYLKVHEEPEDIEYYMCGPAMMNAAMEKMLYNMGVPSEMLMYDDFG